MSGVRGFNLRDLTQHGKAEAGRVTVNVKALPLAAGISSLFTITGEIEVLSLVGVITVVLSAVDSPTIGFTPSGGSSAPAAISAAPASGFTGAVGNVIVGSPTLGGQMPAPVSAITASAAAACHFTAKDGIITVTTSATLTTGTVAWVLSWSSLYPKAQVATVVND
jgi:hypothetical protein